ncbi:MAG: methyltransferase domain-containing protein [bacterium]
MEAEHGPLWAAFLRALSDLIAPGVRVMDLGCNRGGLLAVLAGGYEKMWSGVQPGLAVGVEIDTAPMRALLRAVPPRSDVLFTTAGPRSFPGQFDLVLSHEVVYLLPDLTEVFADLHEALVDGGYVCITTGGHVENPLYERWRSALTRSGVRAQPYRETDYEESLRGAGFGKLRRERLLLTEDEYDRWVSTRPERAPNPDWFPSAAEERRYYVGFGKPIFIAQRAVGDGSAP